MDTRTASLILSAGLLVASFPTASFGQPPGGFNPAERARTALAEPMVGLTTDGTPIEGLYPVTSTGVSTGPVLRAAEHLLETLSATQRQSMMFPVDHSEWRNWANIHRFPREGVSFEEMTDTQRDAAYGLLRASLSARGFETSRDIMRLNHHLAELVDDFEAYGEHLYWITMMGAPSAEEPWGWQLDGHHLIINYFVLGDQVVMTPTFMGSEPTFAESGIYAGTSVLEAEQDLGFAFMRSLTPAQQRQAIIDPIKSRGDNLAEMFSDNVVVAYQGIAASSLQRAQRERLLDLVAVYVGHLSDGHAEVKMEQVRAHLDRTHFAWKGNVGPDAVFYYRIHSPVIFIEFDHQGPVALDGPRNVAQRRHVHSVVRTPNGNDYGADLLRQHYEAHRDDPAHAHQSNLHRF
jgi:hypothetical protein